MTSHFPGPSPYGPPPQGPFPQAPFPQVQAPQLEPEPRLIGHPPPAPWTQVPDRASYDPNAAERAWQLQFAPVPALAPPPNPMPDGPREYQQMLRGPRYRWWRPLLSVLLAGAMLMPLVLLAVLPVVLAAQLAGVPDAFRWTMQEIVDIGDLGPAGFLYVNLALIVLIPTAGLSIWVAHRIRPRFLSSVEGGLRWRWLLRCVAIVVPVWVIYLGLSAWSNPTTGPRPAQWGLLLVMVLLLTPLQAAGEEYLFRGWIMQNVGAWFGSPIVGLVVGVAASVVLFSLAHGSFDIWILGSLGLFALTAGIATWRTGGLEAGIAVHAVNNVGVFFSVIMFGGWKGAFVTADSVSTPLVFAVDLVVHAVVLTLILWQAKKAGIQRHYQPPQPPPVEAPSLAPALNA